MRPLAYVRSAIQQRLPTLLPDHEALRSTLAGLPPDERVAVDAAADSALKGTAAGSELRRWVYGGGKVLPGLVTRREAEAAWLVRNS